MRYWLKWGAFALAVVILALTVINASWLAPEPSGAIKLIAHRGVSQLFDKTGLKRGDCTADRIEPPVHDYLENTVRSMQAAQRLGADVVEVDVAPTRDGQIAIFHDWKVDCLTEGHGEVRSKTMAELKRLDPGFGYTADGGKSFPLRGRQVGAIPTLKEAVSALPRGRIIFNFKGRDPVEADQLAAALFDARRDVVKHHDIFYGAPAVVARIKQLVPPASAWSLDGAKTCSKDYVLYGWTSIVPESCRDGLLLVPLNYQWAFWGWPNRTIQRMNEAGAQVVVIGPYGTGRPLGLVLPEQLGQIPSTFSGYIWVDDIWTVGPAFRPGRDIRTAAQQAAAEEGLKRRREAMAR